MAEPSAPKKPYYPDTGPLAVGARLAFALLILGIAGASLIPPGIVPRFLGSLHLEHFAAFYLLALATAAACPRTQLRKILVTLMGFAIVLELMRVFVGARPVSSMEDLFADIGGMWSALIPIVIGRFRLMFAPR
jgi:ribose/xylose/arabinose/galactoside ABC-type transport system permease subunit